MPLSLVRCPHQDCQYEDNPNNSDYCQMCGRKLPDRPSAWGSSSIPAFTTSNTPPAQPTESNFAQELDRKPLETHLALEPIEPMSYEPIITPSLLISQPPEPVSLDTALHPNFSPNNDQNIATQSTTPSPVPPQPPLARLIWKSAVRGTHAELEQREYWVDRSPTIIGYFHPDSGPVDIAVDILPGWERTSPQHAQLYWDGQQWILQDLGSQSGTFWRSLGNGKWEALKAATPILDQDEISIGPLAFVFKTN